MSYYKPQIYHSSSVTFNGDQLQIQHHVPKRAISYDITDTVAMWAASIMEMPHIVAQLDERFKRGENVIATYQIFNTVFVEEMEPYWNDMFREVLYNNHTLHASKFATDLAYLVIRKLGEMGFDPGYLDNMVMLMDDYIVMLQNEMTNYVYLQLLPNTSFSWIWDNKKHVITQVQPRYGRVYIEIVEFSIELSVRDPYAYET